MRKMMKRVAVVAIAMMCAGQAQAQWKDILKGAASSALGGTSGTAVGTAVDLVGNLLGINKVLPNAMVGTWTYDAPCVVFESEDVLTTLGSSAISTKVENTLGTQLTKLGFTKGKVVMTLKEDGTGTIAYGGKNVNVNWAVSDKTLTITFPMTQRSVSMNVKMQATGLQVAMNATKLATFVTGITSKANAGTTLSTLGTMMKSVKGMYVGLKFTK